MRGVVECRTLDGGRTRVAERQLGGLADRLAGRLLRPGHRGWDDAIRIWNARAASVPALVVQPATPGDVAEAVTFAHAHGLLLSVKGGGHNIAGTAVAPGGLTIDMSRMRWVEVDPDARLAHAGPGCRLRDVDEATQRHGLATPLGFVSDTGLAGLTLGGGFGYLTRRHGWTVDNLVEVEVVTADGEIRIASRQREPELFWALRGGGGNVGVVTRFTLRLHAVGPTITGGLMAWPVERVDEVFAAYRRLTAAAPPELTAAAAVRLAPPAPFVPRSVHGAPVAAVLVCHTGRDPERDLAPLRDLGRPLFDAVSRRPYCELQSLLDAAQPAGARYQWRSEFLPGLSRPLLEAIATTAAPLPSPLAYAVVFHVGGALNERPEDDGAVGNRDARFLATFVGSWPAGAPDEPNLAWVQAGWEAIRPFSAGGNYVNFQAAEDGDERTAAAYGSNLPRLQAVKARYDPDNLFRVNRNVRPVPAPAREPVPIAAPAAVGEA